MRRLAGQAGRTLVWGLHHAGQIVVAVAVLAGVLLLGLGWRLAQGPISLDWAARRLEAQVNAEARPDGPRLAVGHAALAWEGFRAGVDSPLDLRLTDVIATGAGGRRMIDVPQAQIAVSLPALLLGRVVPRSVTIDHPVLRVIRAADGTISFGLGLMELAGGADGDAADPRPLATLLQDFAAAPRADRAARHAGTFDQLRLVRVQGAVVTVMDRVLGAVWHVPQAGIDLRRGAGGGVTGTAGLQLAVGSQTVRLAIEATLAAGDAAATRLRATVSPVNPAGLAGTAPALAMLAALDAPVGGQADLDLGPLLQVVHARLALGMGAGTARIGPSSIPVLGGSLAIEGDPSHLTLTGLELRLPGQGSGPGTTVRARAEARRPENGPATAALTLDVDRVTFAELPELWPKGLGGPGARPWITENITAGTARDGHVEVALSAAAPDLSDLALTGAAGTLEADDLTVHWLRPIPPIEHLRGHLRIVDPDTIQIDTEGGRQAPGALTSTQGGVRLTGLSGHHQVALIDVPLAGPLADAVALLRHPRLHLFDRHPLDLVDPSGHAAVRIAVRLPLEENVGPDDVGIHAHGKLTGVHLGRVVAGLPLDRGTVDLDVTSDRLKAQGTAQLGGIDTQLGVEMDFRDGPPTQVLQHITLAGRAEPRQLAAAGLDGGAVLGAGAIALTASLTERRSGAGEVVAHADLTDAALTLAPLRWAKPAGRPATGDATVRLQDDHLVGIDRLALEGDQLSVQGQADLLAGRPSTLRLDRIVLGQTRAQAQVRFPAAGDAPDAPLAVTASGTLLDLSARLSHAAAGTAPAEAKPAPPADREPGPGLVVDVRFDHAIMGGGQRLAGLSAHAERVAGLWRRVTLDAATEARQKIRLTIAPQGRNRALTANADDAGSLLRALDVTTAIEGGSLSVTGVFDDSTPASVLGGSARVDKFYVRRAPALGKVLQAMTLYGVVDAMAGPGLVFTRLVAPFRITEDWLELADARAFSASLGLTAKGRLNLVRDTADLQGTIVPAYFFNSLLGRIPLVGQLFSPERGGGVFSASYAVRGKLDDPSVSVNPLAVLTPGALRGLFGLLDDKP